MLRLGTSGVVPNAALNTSGVVLSTALNTSGVILSAALNISGVVLSASVCGRDMVSLCYVQCSGAVVQWCSNL